MKPETKNMEKIHTQQELMQFFSHETVGCIFVSGVGRVLGERRVMFGHLMSFVNQFLSAFWSIFLE